MFSLDNCQKKLTVSLTRIDEDMDVKQVIEMENDKPKPPTKPPRFLRSSKRKSSNKLIPLQVTGTSETTPPKSEAIYVSSATVTLSQEKAKCHVIPSVTCSPLKLNGPSASSRGTFVVTDHSIVSARYCGDELLFMRLIETFNVLELNEHKSSSVVTNEM